MTPDPAAGTGPVEPASTPRLAVAVRHVRAWLIEEWPITVVLAGVVVGLAVAGLAEFRSGTVLLAASVVFGAWLRLMLPSSRAGILRVRRKPVDVAVLAGLGLALTVLALVVPSP